MQRAFSLVELSIVLVILGLLTGGILAGQSLIRAAEIRSAITEYTRYMIAARTFRDKYFALPGDMTNATAFWGAADGSTGLTAACKTTASTDSKTCNGDGNGQVDSSTASYEHLRFWQHLANAGLIEGQYNGVQNGAYSPGVNVPGSKAGTGTGFWTTSYNAAYAGDTQTFAYSAGNMIAISNSTCCASAGSAIFKPEEAWNIDTKMDDGLPPTGFMTAFKGSAVLPCTSRANQAAGSADISATYNFTDTAKDCLLYSRPAY